jgi:hypothetical protein
MLRSHRAGVSVALAFFTFAAFATPSVAAGVLTWSTAPQGYIVSVSKTQNGCTAQGIANPSKGYASTVFTDYIATAPYECIWVQARGYINAGTTQAGWTSWDRDGANAYRVAPNLSTGQHQQFVE